MTKTIQLIVAPLKFLSKYRLFQRSEYPLTSLHIILWWEARRLFFNLVVGCTGLITVFIMLCSAFIAERTIGEPIGWPDPPLFAIFGVVFYAIAANVCYTGGWLAELITLEVWGEKAKDFAEISFTLGVVFSIFLTLVPGGRVICAVVGKLIYKMLIQ